VRKIANKEEEPEDFEFFCWCVLGEEGMWGLLGLCFWVCGLGYRERESKEEGVLDLELVVIKSAAWGQQWWTGPLMVLRETERRIEAVVCHQQYRLKLITWLIFSCK
jgi:hypothetical protein